MDAQFVNRISRKALLVFSLIAVLTVLTGFFQAPQPDEGSAAHIFQLSVVAAAAAMLVFLATADWRQPLRPVGRLQVPAGILVAAIGLLYYLEHYFYAAAR